MTDLHKICIIIPYFGTWPDWIDYFLISCKYNPDIKWLIITDCGPKESPSDNISIVNISLQELSRIAGEKLGIPLDIEHPYKLCDLKPSYGIVFSEYISGYDFWGYSDLDLVYGNIRQFITSDSLKEYDIISNHPDFVTGHFCILRNTPFINKLFMSGGQYKNAFLKKKYVGFDEQLINIKINPDQRYINIFKRVNIIIHFCTVFLVKYLKKFIPTRFKKVLSNLRSDELKDFTSVVFYYNKEKKIKVYNQKTFQSDLMLKKNGKKNWKIEWRNGLLKNLTENKELLYFHFSLAKLKKSFIVESYRSDMNSFIISESSIINSDK
jgi:hypothetical protein